MPTIRAIPARLPLLALTIAAAALLAAGCGSSSDSGNATTDWADGLCSAVSTWKDSLQATVDGLKTNGISEDSLKTAVNDAKDSTKTFTDSLDGLGKPDTAAGQQAKESVDTLSTEIKDDIQTIQDAIANASGIAGIATAVQTIQATISKATTQVSDTLTTLKGLDAKGELQQAFTDAPACQSLNGS